MSYNGSKLYFSYTPDGLPYNVEYNGAQYVYALNQQGDVMAILNEAGEKVVEYSYDAWGNILSVTGSMASTLGQINPLRYRGYVYDNETRLYYLQSRYYDPEIGRFVSADAFTSTGQGIIGNNMFAYCGNNPVCRSDYGGTRYCEATTVAGESKRNREISCSYQHKVAKENAYRAIYAEELAVLEGKSSTYKGVPVIITSAMQNAAFSYGVILIGEGITDPHLLRHEYGHILQLREIGISGYTKYIVLPSVACFWATEAGWLSSKQYYNYPWENIADRYGGAQRMYAPGASSLADSYWRFVKGISKFDLLLP